MGKKLTLLGFGGSLFVCLLPTGIGMISTLLGVLCTLAAAGGFAIMFLDRRNIIDLIIGGLIGVSAVYDLLYVTLFIRYGMSPALLSIVGFAVSFYNLAWAFKFKDKNMLVALLLGAAFLYPFALALFTIIVPPSSLIFVIINTLGNIACHAVRAFAAYSEE